MNQIEALQKLRKLGAPVFETRDAAALLAVTPANANVILRRLANQRMLTHLARGKWLMGTEIARFNLPEPLAAPQPACVSLQSALFHHGLIEQVPAVVYAVTPGRPRRIDTPLGTVSLHRVPPELFTGFDIDRSGAKVATAEKALFDTFYLSPGRSRLFARLPELEIPKAFRWNQFREFLRLVKSESRRTVIENRAAEVQRAIRR